jgi:hypothetical protein
MENRTMTAFPPNNTTENIYNREYQLFPCFQNRYNCVTQNRQNINYVVGAGSVALYK